MKKTSALFAAFTMLTGYSSAAHAYDKDKSCEASISVDGIYGQGKNKSTDDQYTKTPFKAGVEGECGQQKGLYAHATVRQVNLDTAYQGGIGLRMGGISIRMGVGKQATAASQFILNGLIDRKSQTGYSVGAAYDGKTLGASAGFVQSHGSQEVQAAGRIKLGPLKAEGHYVSGKAQGTRTSDAALKYRGMGGRLYGNVTRRLSFGPEFEKGKIAMTQMATVSQFVSVPEITPQMTLYAPALVSAVQSASRPFTLASDIRYQSLGMGALYNVNKHLDVNFSLSRFRLNQSTAPHSSDRARLMTLANTFNASTAMIQNGRRDTINAHMARVGLRYKF